MCGASIHIQKYINLYSDKYLHDAWLRNTKCQNMFLGEIFSELSIKLATAF